MKKNLYKLVSDLGQTAEKSGNNEKNRLSTNGRGVLIMVVYNIRVTRRCVQPLFFLQKTSLKSNCKGLNPSHSVVEILTGIHEQHIAIRCNKICLTVDWNLVRRQGTKQVPPAFHLQALVLKSPVILEIETISKTSLIVIVAMTVFSHVCHRVLRVHKLNVTPVFGVGTTVLMKSNLPDLVCVDVDRHALPVCPVYTILIIHDPTHFDLQAFWLVTFRLLWSFSVHQAFVFHSAVLYLN